MMKRNLIVFTFFSGLSGILFSSFIVSAAINHNPDMLYYNYDNGEIYWEELLPLVFSTLGIGVILGIFSFLILFFIACLGQKAFRKKVL